METIELLKNRLAKITRDIQRLETIILIFNQFEALNLGAWGETHNQMQEVWKYLKDDESKLEFKILKEEKDRICETN